MKSSTLKSAPLLCGAILASICVVAEPAEAVPTFFSVHSHTTTSTGATVSNVTVTHQFGTQQIFGANPAFPITMNSHASQRPGWQYEILFDYNQYSPFGQFQVLDLTNIKPQGAPDPIIAFFVKKLDGTPFASALPPASNIIGGGTGLHIQVATSELIAAGNILIIQWNQAPAPGALALLGFAGVVGGRRRRRAVN